MAAYTKNSPGAPTAGFYTAGDTVTDSLGVVWTATRTGQAGPDGFGQPTQFAGSYPNLGVTTAGVGSSPVASVVATEFGASGLHQTVLTLTDAPILVTDALAYGSLKIYDFPEGRIHVLGCVATLAPKTTTAIASTINSGVAGAVGLGTAAASAVTLATTMVDLLPSTVIATSTTINVAAAAVTPVLAAAAVFNGTSTAIDAYLNTSITTATDIDADGTLAYSGTIRITWVNLGDI